jgi:hypothetical protein
VVFDTSESLVETDRNTLNDVYLADFRAGELCAGLFCDGFE